MMAIGNCRFYAQSEHEFIGRVYARLVAPFDSRADGAAELNLLARVRAGRR
jgi:hypothetical protein